MILRALLAVALCARIASADSPPDNLVSGTPKTGAEIDPTLAHLKLDRMRATFTEQKHVALLAKPLRSAGTIYFDRAQGVVRIQTAPKPQQVTVTKTKLVIKSGTRVEEVPLDKSKDLRAFALVFPSLLGGDRVALAASFEIGLYGTDTGWWALSLTPKSESLKKLLKSVVVIGQKSDPVELKITEASGDVTETELTEVARDKAVTDADIAQAFR
ncbi:MAG TPA: outer membrane lipoprotein carrier protein LolA [Kofleriaceae bacterium]